MYRTQTSAEQRCKPTDNRKIFDIKPLKVSFTSFFSTQIPAVLKHFEISSLSFYSWLKTAVNCCSIWSYISPLSYKKFFFKASKLNFAHVAFTSSSVYLLVPQPSVLAYAVHCQTDSHGRPVAGVVVICRDRLTGATYSHQTIVQVRLLLWIHDVKSEVSVAVLAEKDGSWWQIILFCSPDCHSWIVPCTWIF